MIEEKIPFTTTENYKLSRKNVIKMFRIYKKSPDSTKKHYVWNKWRAIFWFL